MLILAIAKREYSHVVVTLMFYSFICILPTIISGALVEIKGPTRDFRKSVMVTSWYTMITSLFLNIFIIAYVLLYEVCDEAKRTTRCKTDLTEVVAAVSVLMLI